MPNFTRLDLNLLTTLDALLRAGSVTGAALELHVTQPAVSASLARLRRHFGDDLLHRVGNKYVMTPLALQLRERVPTALDAVRRVFEAQSMFDPESQNREFTILSSDYAMALVTEAIGDTLARTAPGIRLRFQVHAPQITDHVPEVLRHVDGLLLPHGYMDDLPFIDLFDDGWMCLISASNTDVGDKLTMSMLAEMPWAFTYHSPIAFSVAGRQMQSLGVEPHIDLIVESFLAMPFAVAGSRRIGLIPARMAQRLTADGKVRALPCPYDAVPLREAFWWHATFDLDPAHLWLREFLTQTTAPLRAAAAPDSGEPAQASL